MINFNYMLADIYLQFHRVTTPVPEHIVWVKAKYLPCHKIALADGDGNIIFQTFFTGAFIRYVNGYVDGKYGV